MLTQSAGRPEPGEYPPYGSAYVNLVPAGEILTLLAAQIEETVKVLRPVDDERAATFRYAPEKWTVKESLGHMIDTERIFTYRALRIARHDAGPSPGFEQDDYVRFGSFNRCSLESLLDEFRLVRAATIALYRNLSPEAWRWTGVANKFPVTVRGVAYMTAGHELHHAKILREKYLETFYRCDGC